MVLEPKNIGVLFFNFALLLGMRYEEEWAYERHMVDAKQIDVRLVNAVEVQGVEDHFKKKC